MPSVTIPAGTLHYRTAGPVDSTSPPVVFVHGFLVDSRLWDGVADRLAAAGIRSYLVDWPLGSHRTPMLPDADLTPTGVAKMINDVLGALGLERGHAGRQRHRRGRLPAAAGRRRHQRHGRSSRRDEPP